MTKHLHKKNEEGKSGINISPLIDMVFILLIFFIVTTVFIDERGMEAKTSDIGPISAEEVVSISIREDGRIMSDDQNVGLPGVRPTVRNGMQGPDVPVMISVEGNAPSGIIIRVMDEVKAVAPRASISLSEAAK